MKIVDIIAQRGDVTGWRTKIGSADVALPAWPKDAHRGPQKPERARGWVNRDQFDVYAELRGVKRDSLIDWIAQSIERSTEFEGRAIAGTEPGLRGGYILQPSRVDETVGAIP